MSGSNLYKLSVLVYERFVMSEGELRDNEVELMSEGVYELVKE